MESAAGEKTGKTVKKVEKRESLDQISSFLQRRFPEIGFALKVKKYRVGEYLEISWTDGPEEKKLDDFVKFFKGAEMDKDGIMFRRPSQFIRMDGGIEEVQNPFDFILRNRSRTILN